MSNTRHSNLSVGDEVIVETSIVGTGLVRGKLGIR